MSQTCHASPQEGERFPNLFQAVEAAFPSASNSFPAFLQRLKESVFKALKGQNYNIEKVKHSSNKTFVKTLINNDGIRKMNFTKVILNFH